MIKIWTDQDHHRWWTTKAKIVFFIIFFSTIENFTIISLRNTYRHFDNFIEIIDIFTGSISFLRNPFNTKTHQQNLQGLAESSWQGVGRRCSWRGGRRRASGRAGGKGLRIRAAELRKSRETQTKTAMYDCGAAPVRYLRQCLAKSSSYLHPRVDCFQVKLNRQRFKNF